MAAASLVATTDTALANFGTGCDKQTGRPYAFTEGFTPYIGQNFQVYADGQMVAQGTFSTPEGNGFAAFGQPGVAYTNVTLVLPDGGTVALGDINCPPPAGGGQGDTGHCAHSPNCNRCASADVNGSADCDIRADFDAVPDGHANSPADDPLQRRFLRSRQRLAAAYG